MNGAFEDHLLQSYSESELASHILASPRAAPISSIRLLSSNLIAKHYTPDILEDTIKVIEVARQSGIRAPCIKRIIRHNNDAYCIMERIQGTTLEDAWPKLSWFTVIRLILQLRRFVQILRSVTSLTAGSLATGECRSFWLEDRYGLPARSGPKELTHFLTFWAGFVSIRREVKSPAQGSVHPKGRIPPTAGIFVLTHHDLAPRNIMIDGAGKLWLIDWDYAGFYPKYFEYAGTQNFDIPKDWSLFARLWWWAFVWITVGRYEEDARVLRHIRSKFTRFSAGRRFALLKYGGPSRHPVS